MYSKKIFISILSLLLLSSTFAISAKSPSAPSYQPNQGYQASHVILHTIPVDMVFVGYNQEAISMATLDSIILKHYSAPPMPYVGWTLEYEFSPNCVFANQTYQQALALFVLQNSVVGMNTTSRLNVTALEIQRNTGTKMSVFLPQSGRAIDALAVEDWFATHPYVSSGTSRYTFYILNFTNLDSADHTLEHWYNLTETEYDANTTRDFWRLEWDNPHNEHVGFPYAAFTSRQRLFFIDPSAFN
jgi:hypothetical protein